jgi:DNA transformation protein and related proteins
MATSKDFADYCCELLSGVGTTTAKRMFGGWGIYVDGVTIAVIADLTALGSGKNEKLYLKVDDVTKLQFEAAGGQRFEMESKGKTMGMNYYTTPDETMESSDAMLPWARMALRSALEAKAKAKPKVKTEKSTSKTAKVAAKVAAKSSKKKIE